MRARARASSRWRSCSDHTADKDRAIALSEPYMKDVVANFDNDWTLTGEDIDAYLRKHGAGALAG
jgi:hypothetical protein